MLLTFFLSTPPPSPKQKEEKKREIVLKEKERKKNHCKHIMEIIQYYKCIDREKKIWFSFSFL